MILKKYGDLCLTEAVDPKDTDEKKEKYPGWLETGHQEVSTKKKSKTLKTQMNISRPGDM